MTMSCKGGWWPLPVSIERDYLICFHFRYTIIVSSLLITTMSEGGVFCFTSIVD